MVNNDELAFIAKAALKAGQGSKEMAGFRVTANPANILSLLADRDADKKRIAELEVEAKELIGFKELMAKAAKALNDGEPLNLEALFKDELASSMFAIMFAGEFKRSGAKNFLEILYEVPEFGDLTVTLQKVEGKTPGQRIAELEAYVEVEALGADKAAEECVYWMKRCKELEERMVGVKLAEPIIDAICLMAAEIHNLGRGVSDERAQEIINSMRLAAGTKLEVGE